jgi:acyl-coenzyme A synthetase/AMP-(fatty) acid ligase
MDAGRDTRQRTRAGSPDNVALLAFTSGSTGVPKPVEYRSHHLSAQSGTVRELFELEWGEVAMSTLPPFGLAFSALGLCLAIPDVSPRRPAAADPASLVEEIERLGVAGLFASPGPLDRLSRHCAERGIVLTSLRAVACGGASLDPRTTARMRRCLPEEARLTSVYGATEALPVSRIESRELLGDVRRMSEQGYGSCVGRPLPGNTVRIIGITEEPLPDWSDGLLAAPGAIGEITVTGPGISERYAGRPRDTALAKIRDGERTVHRMGDLGRLDEQGRLWFCGRMSQRVRTPYGDLFTEQVEPIANAVPGVRRSALVGVGPPGAQLAVLCVEAELCLRRRRERGRILSELRERFAAYPHTRRIRRILFHPDLPVDARHQSKIDRESLALWAARQLRRGRRP